MAASKVLFFIVGRAPTTAEQALIDRLAAKGYDVKVRSNVASSLFGSNIEACDYVAGTIPTDAYTGAPPKGNKTDITPSPTGKAEAFKVFPATLALTHPATAPGLGAVSAEQNESTLVITLADLAKDAKVDWTSSDETKATVDTDGVVTTVAAGETTVTATLTSVAAVKASLNCGLLPGNKKFDTVVEAKTAGTAGNALKLALVADAAALKAGSAAVAAGVLTLTYKPDSSTVTDMETLITALGGGDDIIDVKTGGTGATVLDANAAFPAQSLSGGAAAITQTSTCVVTVS